MVAEPLALRVAPTPGALAPSNGTGGSISSDWVALPPRNNQISLRIPHKQVIVLEKTTSTLWEVVCPDGKHRKSLCTFLNVFLFHVHFLCKRANLVYK